MNTENDTVNWEKSPMNRCKRQIELS